MKPNEKIAEALNDLIRINNDRIEGYKKAENETTEKSADLRSLFNRFISESRNYVAQLTREVQKLNEKIAEGTTGAGKIYRAWMDVKATFAGGDRRSLLSACEFGEDAALEAYNQALSDKDLPLNLFQLISTQRSALKGSHDEVKKLRDATQTQY